MKKVLVFLLLACMLCFAACGQDNGANNNEENNEVNGEESNNESGVLVMATNAEFPPYEYHEGGEIVGIDAEVARAIADYMGMELQIEDMDFTAILAAVQSGKADFGMAGLTVTEDRLQSVDFTTSYATGIQSVIVTEDSPIASVDDLFAEGANNLIGVQESTTGDIYTTDDIEAAGLGTIERYNKGADAVQALLAGKIDCVVIDSQPAQAFVAANEGLKILETQYAVEDYAICYAKDNAELGAKINEALEALIADGTVQGIIDKYITE